MTTTIKITQFDPLQLELPKVDGPVAGDVTIELPAVHIKVRELFGPSWRMPDTPYVGGDLDGYGYSFTLTEPVELSQLVGMVARLQDSFQKAHSEIQRVLDEKGALLDPVMG